MKKLCNKCGSELDLGKRLCDHCGAFNPFFISSFKQAFASENIEKRKLAEWAVNEERNTTTAPVEKPAFKASETEQEKNEPDLKKEIQRIRLQSELSTNEIRQELRNIEEENRKLRTEIDSISRLQPVAVAEPAPQPQPQDTPKKAAKKGNGLVVAVGIAVLLVGFVVGYFFLNKPGGSELAKAPVEVAKTETVSKSEPDKPAEATNPGKDTTPSADVTVAKPEPGKPQQQLAIATPPAKRPKPVAKPIATVPAPAKNNVREDFVLSEAKAKIDLVGRKLSGCGISVNKAGEIVSLQNLVMVEELPTGAVKYKCMAKIVQGGETYTVTPYMYYNPDGVLINVDGTNCE